MFNNALPYCNRETTRKVERYRRKHPKLTFTQAYNKIYHTNYSEPSVFDTTGDTTINNGSIKSPTSV